VQRSQTVPTNPRERVGLPARTGQHRSPSGLALHRGSAAAIQPTTIRRHIYSTLFVLRRVLCTLAEKCCRSLSLPFTHYASLFYVFARASLPGIVSPGPHLEWRGVKKTILLSLFKLPKQERGVLTTETEGVAHGNLGCLLHRMRSVIKITFRIGGLVVQGSGDESVFHR